MCQNVSKKYVAPYENLNLPWYKCEGLLTYTDQLKCKEFIENPEEHFSKVKVINFDIIHNQCRG